MWPAEWLDLVDVHTRCCLHSFILNTADYASVLLCNAIGMLKEPMGQAAKPLHIILCHPCLDSSLERVLTLEVEAEPVAAL
jgi:hypothetical protein